MTNTYDGTGPRSPQWWPSRYGAGDEKGAANELTPERTLAAGDGMNDREMLAWAALGVAIVSSVPRA